MAPKIPRMSPGDRPSAVSRYTPSGSGIEPLLKGFSDLAGTAVDIAADAEGREAERLRSALEVKQAIANDTAGARMAADYEEGLIPDVEALKRKNAKTPEKLIAEFIPLARAKADAFQKDAGNGEQALDFSRQSSSLIQAETRRLHDWVSTQQTQNIKDDVSKMLNSASAKAGRVPSLTALGGYISEQEGKLLPRAILAYGEAEGRDKVRKMRSDIVEEWYYGAGLVDPKGAAATLDDGPAAENLSTSQRMAIRRDLKDAFEGRGVAQFEQLTGDTVRRNMDIYQSVLNETLDGTTILAMRRENAARQEALEKDPTLDDKQRGEQLGVLKQRTEFLDYATKLYRKRIPAEIADTPDAIAAQAEIIGEYEALFKNPDDSEDGDTARGNLPRVLALQHKAAALALDKKLGGTRLSTIMGAVGKMADEAAQAEAGKSTWSLGLKWSPPFVSVTQTADQAGHERLNDLFETGDYREVPQNVRNAAWFYYTSRINAAGTDVSTPQAQAIAQESIDWAIARSRRPR